MSLGWWLELAYLYLFVQTQRAIALFVPITVYVAPVWLIRKEHWSQWKGQLREMPLEVMSYREEYFAWLGEALESGLHPLLDL